MEYKESKETMFMELDDWQQIIHSENWRVFLKLLKNHQDYLQTQVNLFLANHEDRKAGEELAKLNDCKKFVGLVQNRITELRKGLGE